KRNGTNQTRSAFVSIQLPGHKNTTLTPIPTQGTNTTGSAPGLVPSGQGRIPTAFPHYFSFGVLSQTYFASLLDAMRSQNGTAFAFRYQYLSGGVNTNRGWETWSQPAGQYATTYMQENAQHGYTPAFVYY